jgi:uncharacterized protein DUF5703/glycosyl hydrolase family 95
VPGHLTRLGIVLAALPATAAPLDAQSFIELDRAAQIARADLDYRTPAARPEEGMPVGNGRMGSLVWTTPDTLRFQVNRVDVHAMDSTTFSFPRADSDYGYGCGFVDVTLVASGDAVFDGSGFRQHLSLYDGVMTAAGAGVTARVVAWPDRDVMAIEIDDRRSQPEPVAVALRMLRYQAQYVSGQHAELAQAHAVVFRTAAHTATSTLGIRDGRITLTQQFREGDFYGASGIAISVIGRRSRARYADRATVELVAAPAAGRFTILIGSAASAAPSADLAAAAGAEVAAAEREGFAGIEAATARWWHAFWDRGAVYLHSASGQADLVEASYDYFLYLMGASSRGAFPPRFGGGLWQTDGDMSRWGSQYWWANTSAYYSNLMPANRVELMDPMFRMYEGMLDAAALAARQQWGSEGIWIPETTFFNGPERLPDELASDLQALVLARKPFEARSASFDAFAGSKNRHNSRWNFNGDGEWKQGRYVFTSKGAGVFGHTTHILGVASRIGNLAWQRYQLTGDAGWLRDHGYAFIKGAAEFYRRFPNLQKDAAGVYHISHTNSGESGWDSTDAPYEVSCMQMIFPLAVRASEALGVDAALRPAWREVAEHLVAVKGRARCGTGSEIADDRVYDGPGAIDPIGPEPELKRRFLGFTRLGRFIDPAGIGGAQVFRNRLRLREGPGAIDAEHIAGLASGLHTSLLDSHPGSSTGEEPMQLFTDWPRDWDAAFTLLARGGFIVSAARQGGEVPLVEIVSTLGGRLRLANPWGARAVTVFRNGRNAEDRSGTILAVNTAANETIVLAPKGAVPRTVKFPR